MSSSELGAGGLAQLRRGDDQAPLHVQLEDTLRALIQSGRARPGSTLPGELDIASHLQLSRHTVRHALGTLAAEGLLQRGRGRGTQIRPSATAGVSVRGLNRFYAFTWENAERGLTEHSRVLEFKQLRASAKIASHLSLGRAMRVQRIQRVRTAGGEPLMMEIAYVPVDLADGLECDTLEHASIYDELERLHAVPVTHARETIRPMVLSRRLAAWLDSAPGAPAFLVERTTWSGSRAIEWQESTVRGDRFRYSVDLDRPGGTTA